MSGLISCSISALQRDNVNWIDELGQEQLYPDLLYCICTQLMANPWLLKDNILDRCCDHVAADTTSCSDLSYSVFGSTASQLPEIGQEKLLRMRKTWQPRGLQGARHEPG